MTEYEMIRTINDMRALQRQSERNWERRFFLLKTACWIITGAVVHLLVMKYVVDA